MSSSTPDGKESAEIGKRDDLDRLVDELIDTIDGPGAAINGVSVGAGNLNSARAGTCALLRAGAKREARVRGAGGREGLAARMRAWIPADVVNVIRIGSTSAPSR